MFVLWEKDERIVCGRPELSYKALDLVPVEIKISQLTGPETASSLLPHSSFSQLALALGPPC